MTAVNGSGSTYSVTTTESAGLAINLNSQTNGGSNVLYGLKLAAPGSTPYRVRILLQWKLYGVDAGGTASVFAGWIDSSGKLMIIDFRNDPEFFLAKFNSASSYNTSYGTYTLQQWEDMWFGLYNDGTNVHLQMSPDGVNFVTLASDSVSGGFLADYGHIIWGFNNANSSSIMSLTLRCYDVNGLSAAFPNQG